MNIENLKPAKTVKRSVKHVFSDTEKQQLNSDLLNMTTAIAPTTQAAPAIPRTVKSYLTSDYFKKQVALCLPRHMTAERFVRIAITATTRVPKLLKCTPESVVKCCLALSELGLEPDGRRAHLIPYGDQCTLVVDYKGLVELAMNSGTVSSIFAERVCDKDEFTWDTGEVHHTINWREDRGKMYAVYVVVKFKDGGKHTEVMTRADVDRIRGRSKAGNNGPWVSDYDEMAKKTVFRRASKWIKLSPEVHEALDKSDKLSAVAPPDSLVEEIAGEPDNIEEFNPALADTQRLPDDDSETPQPPRGGHPPNETPQPQQSRKVPAAPTDQTPGEPGTPQDELYVRLTNAGHSFEDLKTYLVKEFWDQKTCDQYQVDSWTGYESVPSQVTKQLLKIKTLPLDVRKMKEEQRA